MKLSILHDDRGHIVATSKVGDLTEAGSKFAKVGMVPRKGQRLVEIDSEELDKLPAHRLHDEYEIDVHTSKLVKKKKP